MFGHQVNAVSGSPQIYDYRLSNTTSESRSSSPAARSIPSGRKGSKKVRTGCVTCKVRKVKCDETKPFCSRCTKTGRKCDGYLDPRALTKRRSLRDVAAHDHVLGTLLELVAPEEKRAFWFFQNYTAPCISGGFDTGFWKVTVLQICQSEPAVRHAVLAVSSLHEALGGTMPSTDGSLARPHPDFALQQYNKAISRLLVQMNDPLTRPLARLLTCVLFVCVEYMRGQDKESLIHLEQGRQLLAQLYRRSNDPEIRCINQHIVPLYTRLSLTSFLFGGSPVPITDAARSQTHVSDTFDSIDNVRHSMHEFMEQAFRFTQRARPAKNPNGSIPRGMMQSLEVEQNRLLALLAKLDVAFSLFRASRSNPGPENALLVLQMYLHAQHICISTALSSSEVVYDDFLPSFAAIVPLAAAYLDLESSSHHRAVVAPRSLQYCAVPEQLSVAYTDHFTFETHIIPPLYYVATKCRHPLIRRSALDLLRRNPFRRENLWRASVMGALAGHVVSLEERWSQGHYPGQDILAHTHSHNNIGPYSNAMEVDQSLVAVSRADLTASMPTLSFEAAVNSSLPLDVEVSSSLSHTPLLTTSGDDSYSSGSMVEPTMAFLSPPNHSDTWHWQQQQQHQMQNHADQAAGQISYTYTSSGPYDTMQSQSHQGYMSHGSAGYSSNSASSEISSVDLEEQSRYHQEMVRGYSPPHQWQSPPPRPQQTQQRKQAYQKPAYTPQESSMGAAPPRQRSPPPSNLVMEAPFGLPEEMRVHDAIVGPEREDGTWVAVFRKLHGVDTDWDVQDDWVAMV